MEIEGAGNAGLISRATDWWSFFMNDERHFQGLIGMFLIGILCVFGCCMVTFLCWWHFYYEPILKAYVTINCWYISANSRVIFAGERRKTRRLKSKS